ncbi:ABC transporter permease, partial [Micromonospora tulbaghiae]
MSRDRGTARNRHRDTARKRLRAARLGPRDVLHVGSSGLRSRPMRVVLSALGIAIGIATMISVVGISASSQAQLLRELDKLGTNLLVASPGESMFSGQDVRLPEDAAGMVGRIRGVQEVGATADLNATVRRNERIDEGDTGGIAVKATTADLLRVLRGEVRSGSWLNAATGRYPSVVLGHVSAERLGITKPGQQVWLGGRYFTVTGILAPLPLAPEIERSALVGWEGAKRLLGFEGHPTSVYERSDDAVVQDVREVMAATVDPRNPQNVK